MPRLSRRGFLGGALVGIASTSLPEGAGAEPLSEEPEEEGLPPSHQVIGVQLFCNGEEHRLRVRPSESSLEAIRGQLGLTGSKPACGSGACGACTILVDGAPRASCVLPATALEARTVTTVEGLASGPGLSNLNPIQRAFLAEDAVQCGFCTPGMVVAATAFHDRWRATRGNEEPEREEIAAALEGHLCRCGAYPAVYRAVAAACRGEHDHAQVQVPRVEGPAKVTGAARFTVDVALDGALHAAVLRAPVAHGVVRGIDDSGALTVPGVAATASLVGEGATVHYVGQPLWAVAATTEQAARSAVELVKLEIQSLQPLLSAPEAQDPAVPVLFGPGEAPLVHDLPGPAPRTDGNVRGPVSRSWGQGSAAAKRAVVRAESLGHTVHAGSWRVPARLHAALEPHVAVARFEPSESGARLEVWASTEGVGELAQALASHFDLRPENVEVHAEHVGGGFGGKHGLQPEVLAAATLARDARAPVRLQWAAGEELASAASGGDQALQVSLVTGAQGTLEAIEVEVEHHGGGAAGGATSALGRLLYEAPKHLTDTDVLTNLPPAQALRGEGAATFFGVEGTVDQLAHVAGESPVAFRRRWDPDPVRAPLYDWVDGLDRWTTRNEHATIDPRFRTGVGVAVGAWFHRWDPATQVALEAGSSGVVARVATQDAGAGTRSLIAAAVAAKLGVSRSDVEVEVGHSRLPHGPASGGGVVAASVVPAAEHAVEQLIEVLVDRAEAQGIEGVPVVEGIETLDGTLVRWRDLLADQPPVWVIGRRKREATSPLLPLPTGGLRSGAAVPSVVQVTEVRVDTVLGRVQVVEAWVGVAAGRRLTPQIDRSQVEGAVVQGIGTALFEQRRVDPATGHVLTRDLDHYRIPGMGDAPKVNVHFAAPLPERADPSFDRVRGGTLDIWELAAMAGPASIGNAVFHAIGARPRALPLTPGLVLELLS